VLLLTYWNRFFGLGLWVAPRLPAAGRALERCSPGAHLLLTLGLLGLLGAIHAGLPREVYALTCGLNGPLGFCLVGSLAMLLRRSARGGPGARVWHPLVHVGSHSMPFYLFHLYFVSGVRIALEHGVPGLPLAVHLVLGCVMGGVGPWLFFKFLEPQPLFRWSVGLPPGPVRASPAREGAPHAEAAVISSA
jgi:peptidoglycan/LPS O-acetylase OafA/YrhL